jgi:hypothetical protein
MPTSAEIAEIVEDCTYAIAVAIKNNNPDPAFEVYEHDAFEDVGDNGCLVTLYEYDVLPEIRKVTCWQLKYGVQLFHAAQLNLINATNLAIQAIERPFPTRRFGYIKAEKIHAVTDYYKATSRLTNLVFVINLYLRPATPPPILIGEGEVNVEVER